MDYTQTVAQRTVEYIDDDHLYLVDGVIVPSITQILAFKFGKKYDNVPRAVLDSAARKGTDVHEAIQRLCETGEASDLKEVRNFLFLQSHYGFDVLANEVPVILFHNDTPIAAGRLDLVLKMDGKIGGADIKRTSVLDKNYLAYQLNLYRLAYKQSYGVEWEFLRGIHLRDDVRRFVNIPIDEPFILNFINEWRMSND
ncbi:MAG: hypothetical protein IJL00_00890 [Clostridia bacterium]|nr:hypothetical protein [Clostridia bacterium]